MGKAVVSRRPAPRLNLVPRDRDPTLCRQPLIARSRHSVVQATSNATHPAEPKSTLPPLPIPLSPPTPLSPPNLAPSDAARPNPKTYSAGRARLRTRSRPPTLPSAAPHLIARSSP